MSSPTDLQSDATLEARAPRLRDGRLHPLLAWRSLRRLIANPDDTARVFEIIDALSGNNDQKNFIRFRSTEAGRRVLAEERDILATLSARDALLELPVGSLGHTYAEFMNREQISADGLVDASEAPGDVEDFHEDPDGERFGARLRDTHDLWHVVTGYNRDLIGEASLLSFTYAQIKNRGIGVIVAMAWWRAGGVEQHARRMIREAFKRGKNAAWLPGADWEALLPVPLDEVRRCLGVGEPPSYREVRSAAGEAALTTS